MGANTGAGHARRHDRRPTSHAWSRPPQTPRRRLGVIARHGHGGRPSCPRRQQTRHPGTTNTPPPAADPTGLRAPSVRWGHGGAHERAGGPRARPCAMHEAANSSLPTKAPL